MHVNKWYCNSGGAKKIEQTLSKKLCIWSEVLWDICMLHITFPDDWHSSYLPEDSTFPFPWASSLKNPGPTAVAPSTKVSILQIDSGKRKSENFDARTLHSGTWRFDAYVDRYPSLHDLLKNLDKSFPGKVRFQLPQLDALSGSVLRHCINFIDGLIDSLSPVMFKVGFTHNPLWRWGNAMYGYGKSNEKWSEMVVIYLAPEAHSPTMLEAALIEKYKGASMKL